MPVALRKNGYAFLFYGADSGEPAHVHVRKGDDQAKFWLEPFVRVAWHRGLRPHQLNEVERLVMKNKDLLLEAWNEFFRK